MYRVSPYEYTGHGFNPCIGVVTTRTLDIYGKHVPVQPNWFTKRPDGWQYDSAQGRQNRGWGLQVRGITATGY